MAGTSLVPVVVTVSAAAGISTVAAAVATTPAKAATRSVLVLLQNGETTAPETADAQAAGFTVTQVTPATWDAMTASQFSAYSALVIGDPSSGTKCSTLTPTTATSGTDAIGTTWQSAVNGKIAVLGTAPALAGSAGSASVVTDAISYAATQPSTGSSTGLYVSLNCQDSSSTTTPVTVSLLNGVEGTGTAGGLKAAGQGSTCVAANSTGTVNKLAADQAPPFGGLASSALASGQWPSPACAVQETFSAWPANYTPVAYDTSAAGPANFTASDGATGQPYILLGGPAPSAATRALAPTTGGEVPQVTTAGGQNAAAPGVQQATAGDPVNTENGDFTQSSTDVSVPGFGPDLSFTRTYDSATATEQTEAGTPGPMGYGWTDSLASSLTTDQPTPGDIYTLDGLATDTGNGGPAASGALNGPADLYRNGGNLYFADLAGNRIEEVPGASGTQWGISMTAGNIYTIAGNDAGVQGDSPNGTPASRSLLCAPFSVTMDSAGNLYIADTNNNRVLEVPVTTGTQRGIAMTANNVYTIAGSATGTEGDSGNGGPATSALLSAPSQITVDKTGANPALEIADNGNNRIQYIFKAGGTDWEGASYTAGDIYTIAGSSTGAQGNSGDGSLANSASVALDGPEGICLSTGGDLYIADEFNEQVRVIPGATTSKWGPSMTAGHIYTVVGPTSGASGTAANGTAATSALLNGPVAVTCAGSTSLYIADQGNSEIQEVSTAATSAWGLSMAADKIYTVAGSNAGAFGNSGNGGLATAALLNQPIGMALDSAGNLDISDTGNNVVRQVSATTFDISTIAGSGGTFAQDGDGGPSTTAGLGQPDAVTFDSAGDLFIADLDGNRVQEIAARSHTQFGIAMTAGDVYTVAGSAIGLQGDSGDGGPATAATLSGPDAVTVDSAGNLYLADSGNGMIKKVSASTGIITAVAGQVGGFGDGGNNGPATSATLELTSGLAVDAAGDVFISDEFSNQVREVAAASGTQWGIAMTAGDIYLIAGSSTGRVRNRCQRHQGHLGPAGRPQRARG